MVVWEERLKMELIHFDNIPKIKALYNLIKNKIQNWKKVKFWWENRPKKDDNGYLEKLIFEKRKYKGGISLESAIDQQKGSNLQITSIWSVLLYYEP